MSGRPDCDCNGDCEAYGGCFGIEQTILADIIEIHVAFDRPKSAAHMQRIANALVKVLQRDLGEHFARQRPSVYVADIRGPEDDE
jgi:hypothetical protein